MSDYADTGTSREGDPYAAIAALKQRVAELERELEAARLDTIEKLRGELAEAREIIGWYGEAGNNRCTVYDPASGEMITPVMADEGQRARAFLAAERK